MHPTTARPAHFTPLGPDELATTGAGDITGGVLTALIAGQVKDILDNWEEFKTLVKQHLRD